MGVEMMGEKDLQETMDRVLHVIRVGFMKGKMVASVNQVENGAFVTILVTSMLYIPSGANLPVIMQMDGIHLVKIQEEIALSNLLNATYVEIHL
jgi:hypothetical protein